MRVLIDASPLLLRSAGIKTYIFHWLMSLRQQSAGVQVDAFPFLGRWGALNHERSLLSRWATWPRLAMLYAANLPGSPLPGLASRLYDVCHLSNQIRRPPAGCVTATLHDLTAWLHPEWHTPGNVLADKTFVERVLRRARGIIAVSEHTRRDAVRLAGLPEDRVEVVYPGVAEQYFDALPAARERPYVLFVGTIEPRKNLALLLDAWQTLGPDLRDCFELIVAGPPGWGDSSVLARLEAGEPGVRYLGYVSEAYMPGLVAGTAALVYPSLYEGFGFPVAQAMAAGVPVLTSCVSSLPEITAGAALLADPESLTEVASALRRLLESPALRARLGAEGRKRAELFRWDRCARQSLEFFQRVAGRALR